MPTLGVSFPTEDPTDTLSATGGARSDRGIAPPVRLDIDTISAVSVALVAKLTKRS